MTLKSMRHWEIIKSTKKQRRSDVIWLCVYTLAIRQHGKHGYGVWPLVNVGARHLHQRMTEHKSSAIGKNLEFQHGLDKRTPINDLFEVLREMHSQAWLSGL